MNRARIGDGLIAAAATLLVSWPLTTLFAPASWARPALNMIIIVMLAGWVGRALFATGPPVLVLQIAAAVLGVSWQFGRGHLWHGLPTTETVIALNRLLVQARITVEAFAAPAPTNRGVIAGAGIAVALVAVLVDYLSATRRSPALAGLPLLTAYLISAANSGEALKPQFFLSAAAAWLIMMGRQGIASLRRWSTAAPLMETGRSGEVDGTMSFAATGRVLGIAGLVLAVVLPPVLPHLPTRFLADGLGRSANGTGFHGDDISLNTTIDLDRNLRDPSTAPVLTYTTTDTSPPPLRIEALSDYNDGLWQIRRMRTELTGKPHIPAPPGLGEGVRSKRERIEVTENRVQPPQLAAPYPVSAGDLDGARWGLNANLSPRVNSQVDNYALAYVSLSPTSDQLSTSEGDLTGDPALADNLSLDPESEAAVTALAKSIVPDGATPIEAARLIQAHLRSPNYRYDLQLAPARDKNGNVLNLDPISHFLRTRQGYCVQFATAMVMMARSQGIPARMAIGFLPGVPDGKTYTVRASDAHAWPELYFRGVGWLRFEPTPASRASAVPPYSIEQRSSNSTGPSSTASTPTTGATGGAGTVDGAKRSALNEGPSAGSTSGGAVGRWWADLQGLGWGTWLLIVLVISLIGALSVPAAARFRHRRARQEAKDEAERIEVEWQAMIGRLSDLGIAPPVGSTPRQTGDFLRHQAYLGDSGGDALTRVVMTLEQSRYARPGEELPDIAVDSRAVVSAAGRSRPRKDRLRAAWLPQEGVGQWERSWYAVTSAPSRAAQLVRRLVGR